VLKVPTRPEWTLSLSRESARYWAAGVWRIRRAIFLALVVPWFAPRILAKEDSNAAGKLEGTAFVGDPDHGSYVAGAKVVARGPVTLETETNADGKYAFVAVPAGSYTVKASFSGLEAKQAVLIETGRLVHVNLQLRPEQAKESVTVRASDPDGTASTETIATKTLRDAPNADERFESLLPLIPGVVRGPDGHINLKGTRNTQSGALVNSANVTDPATGGPAITLPIDVVSSVQVISNPYDPEYGKLTGAISTVETKTGDYKAHHFSIQNVLPRLRDRDGSIAGIGAATPRMTFTGPIIKDRVALMQSFEYRFVRTPVNSLPPLQRDTKLESFNSYTQTDLAINPKQTATLSLAIYPQKLDYMGLNTFTPQPSTADFHQRGYQVYGQHRYLAGSESALISQFSYKSYDADVTAQNDDPYQLLIDTTEGGYFNRQARRTSRFEWQESYQFAPRQFFGSHQSRAGLNYAHSSYQGKQTFLPVEIIGAYGTPIERISFTQPSSFSISQNETSWFVADQWAPFHRLSFNLGMRFDNDTVTSSMHIAPRLGFLLALTNDGKTLLKGGGGLFYDRVPLMLPIFEQLPDRTVSRLDANGQAATSTFYQNRITGGLQNPRSTAWNIAVERQVTEHLAIRVSFEQRNTARDFIVEPTSSAGSGVMALSNEGSDSYREFQISGRYRVSRLTVNSSYAHSRAYGNLNDPALFFGNYPQAVIQPDARARLPFDAPNRFLLWAEVAGPWKLTLLPVYDLHTGFTYSVQNEFRDYIGPRNTERFPRFSSMDLQASRPFSLHVGDKHALQLTAGFGVFNVFNHFNPRDVQNDLASSQFGGFFNDAWREYRGKFVFHF
jgi:hypothetical protein